MIDTLFTCNPLEPRKGIDHLSALSLSRPFSTSLLFFATTCQKRTLTNNKSHVRLTQRLHFTFLYLNDTSRAYRNICSRRRTWPWVSLHLSSSSVMALPQHLTLSRAEGRQTRLETARLPRLCWRTGKLTADYCKLWKLKHLTSSLAHLLFSLFTQISERCKRSSCFLSVTIYEASKTV